MILPAAVASAATPAQSISQYIQPEVTPAQAPSSSSACTENEPVDGRAADISPSIRMISVTSAPVAMYRRTMAGPAVAMATPEPTKSPAPMTPPRAIIDRWRCLRPCDKTGSPFCAACGETWGDLVCVRLMVVWCLFIAGDVRKASRV